MCFFCVSGESIRIDLGKMITNVDWKIVALVADNFSRTKRMLRVIDTIGSFSTTFRTSYTYTRQKWEFLAMCTCTFQFQQYVTQNIGITIFTSQPIATSTAEAVLAPFSLSGSEAISVDESCKFCCIFYRELKYFENFENVSRQFCL